MLEASLAAGTKVLRYSSCRNLSRAGQLRVNCPDWNWICFLQGYYLFGTNFRPSFPRLSVQTFSPSSSSLLRFVHYAPLSGCKHGFRHFFTHQTRGNILSWPRPLFSVCVCEYFMALVVNETHPPIRRRVRPKGGVVGTCAPQPNSILSRAPNKQAEAVSVVLKRGCQFLFI